MPNGSNNLALFDLDHTLLPLDSDQEWNRFFSRIGVAEGEAYAQQVDRFYDDYAAGTLDMEAYLEYILAPLTKYSRSQLAEWHAQFMQEVITPAIRPSARALVDNHRESGDLCCIVTATNSFVTLPIANYLNVPNLIAVELATEGNDPNGRYTGGWVGMPSFREGKIVRTEQWLESLGKTISSFDRSYFYSDSANDIPLMEKVSHPVATNPDEKLRRTAVERRWQVIEML